MLSYKPLRTAFKRRSFNVSLYLTKNAGMLANNQGGYFIKKRGNISPSYMVEGVT